MKKIALLSITSLIFSLSFAQLENTRWKTILHINGPVGAIVDFKKDSLSIYTVSDSTIIETMTYTKNDTSFTVTKIDGQSDCDNSSSGKYSFNIKRDSLFIRVLKDDCSDRYSVLDKTMWSRWKVYPGIKVDEAILQQYTGVYAADEAHPIIVSLSRGVLYAEGPNSKLPKSPFTAITTSRFFLRIAGVELDFVKDKNGSISSLISHEEKDIELKKIK